MSDELDPVDYLSRHWQTGGSGLQQKVDELIEETRQFVRKSPAVAVGVAAALGFVIARVVKAGIDGAADAGERNSTRKPTNDA